MTRVKRTSTHRNRMFLPVLFVAALAALLLSGCSTATGGPDAESNTESDAENSAETSAAPSSNGPSTSSETSTAQQEGTNAGQGGNRNARVALRVEGDPGISFAGTCRVGGREETIEGDTPQRYDYRLREGQPVNCEVQRTDGKGNLVLNLRSGGTIFNQESNGDAVLRASLNASEDGSDSISSTSVNSSSSVQQSGGSSSSTSSSSINVIQGDQSDE